MLFQKTKFRFLCPTIYCISILIVGKLNLKINFIFLSDIHFVPQAYSCPFCSLDFDIIGDFNNFEEDLKFLAKELNISASCSFKSLLQSLHQSWVLANVLKCLEKEVKEINFLESYSFKSFDQKCSNFWLKQINS